MNRPVRKIIGLARTARIFAACLLPLLVLPVAGPVFGQMTPPGNALDFDGANDYANCGGGINLANQSFTLECWARRDTATTADYIFGQGGAWVNNEDLHVGFRDTDEFTFGFYGNDLTTPGTYTDTDWHHWACVYDASLPGGNTDRWIYRDGVLVASNEATANYQGSGGFVIGNDAWFGAEWFDGLVDEVRIWTVARTQAEIRGTMYEPLVGTETNLAAYYDFDQTNPDAVLTDRAGGDDNGTLNNMDPATDWVASGADVFDPPGYALDFNGAGDYVNIGDIAALDFGGTSPYTFEFWLNPTVGGNGGMVFAKYNQTVAGAYRFSVGDTGFLYSAREVFPWGVGGGTIPFGEYSHVATTYDGATLRIYVNGTETASEALGGIPTNTEPFMIGAQLDTGAPSDFFDGRIDEVRIWNTARSPLELQNNMHNTIDPASNPNLVAYYRSDHTSGGTLIDLTANLLDGTLNGTPVWTSSEAMCPFANPPTDITPTGFTAGWDTVNGATGYRIDVDDDPLFGSPEVLDLDAGAVTSYPVVTALAGGTVSYYRVRAERSGWTSPSSAPMEVMPPPGYALDFDGTDDYVDIRDGVVFNGNFSVEGWVYVRSYNYFSRLICFGNGIDVNNVIFGLSEDTSGRPYFEIIETAGQRCASPTPIPLNTWTHLAASLDGTTGRLFINGTEVAVQAGMEIPANVTRVNNYIGRSNYPADAYANAIFDEIRIWNDVRTQQEIRDNMNNTVDPASGGLVACYRFDHTDGNILPDLTANENHGELVNMDPASDWTSSGAFNVWTGAVDADWQTAANWSRGTVPVATDNVAIPAGLGDPVVAGGFAYCNHLTVATGANLVLNNDDLRVTGNIHNSGSITSPGAGGYLVCSGSSAQYVQGGTIEKIAINNAAGVVLESDLTVADALTMTTGTITANGNTIVYGAGAVLAYLGAAPQTSSDAEFPATNGPDYLTIINSTGVTLHAGRTVTNVYLSDGPFDTGGNVLTVNGDITVNTGSFATGSNVTFAGAGAGTALPAGTYGDVEINRAAGIGLGGDVAIDGTLTLTDGPVTLGAANLTLGPAAAIGGVPSGANMVITDGTGELRRVIPGPGTFVYPVGDAMGNYSPVELGFTGGTFLGGYAGVIVANTVHPDNTSATDYLSRYWTLTSDIPDFSCDATFTYVNGDIVGTEADIYGGEWDGGAWTLLGPVDAGANQISVTVSAFNRDYTGGEMSALEMAAPGYLLSFDGIDDYVSLGNSAALHPTGAITFELWANHSWATPSSTWDQMISVTETGGYSMGLRDTGNLEAMLYRNGAYGELAYPLANLSSGWHHFACSYDGRYFGLYVDGVLVDVDDAGAVYPIQYANPANALMIAAEAGPGATPSVAWYFPGQMDEVRIWNVARTESQIRDNMNNTINPSDPGLLAYCRFDQTTGTTLADLSGNGNDGSLNGTPGPMWQDSEAFNVWTGAIDTDWHNAGNWNDGVPGASDNVSIPAGLGNYPVAGMNAYCNHLTVAAGASVAAGLDQYLYVAGNIYNNGAITGTGNWMLVCNGDSPQYLQIGTIENIEINNNAGVVLESDDLIVSGMLSMADGVITLNGQLVTYLPGAALGYPGPFGPGTPQITSDVEFPDVNGPTDLYVVNPAGVTLHAGRTLSGSVNIAPGSVLNSGGFDLYVGGAWINDGAFTPGAGTVWLNGSGQAVLGSTTFNNLVKTVAVADTLWFDAGSTQTVTGTLTLQGAAGNLLTIQSNGPPTQWNIDPQGTRNIAYLQVQGSNNTNALVIDAVGTNSVSLGNNTNWNFDAPAAVDDAYTVDEDTVLAEAIPGVLSNDTDVDLDPLTAVLDSGVSNGVLTLNPDGSFDYTPNADFYGTDTFTYHANDGYADSNVATVTITVDPVNDQPAFTAADPPAAGEDAGSQTVAGWASGFDPGNTYETSQAVLAYSVSGVDNPGLFSVTPTVNTAGTLAYTPAPDAAGTSDFVVAVQDNGGTPNGGVDTSATQTFTIAINPVNDPPGFTAVDPPAVLEDPGPQTLAGWVTAFDPGAADESGQSVLAYAVTAVGNASLFTAPPSVDPSGILAYTPAPDAFGTSTFDITVQDDGGTADGGVDTSIAQTFTITVNPVNDPPAFAAGNPPAVPEDAGPQTVVGWAAFNPGNTFETGQTAVAYTVSDIGDPSLFTAPPSVSPDGTLAYTPAPGAYGLSTMNVTVRDNGGVAGGGVDTSAVQTFTINIGEVNDAPVITEGETVSVTMDEDSTPMPFSLALNAADPDPPPVTLTWSVSVQATNGLASASGTGNSIQVLYVPDNNFEGTDAFTVRVSDGDLFDEIWVDVAVSAVNDAPVLDDSGYMRLNPIAEDVSDTDNIGTSVADIIASAGGDRITDPDAGDPEGIAVIAVNNDNGLWQYDHVGDGNFVDFPWNVSETEAVLLNETAMTRFVPNEDFYGIVDPGITFRAWDQTAGVNGETGTDTTINGGGTAFSEATETAFITTNIGIDMPVILQGETVTVEMDEGGSPTPFNLFLTAEDPDGDILAWDISYPAQNGEAGIKGAGNMIQITYRPGLGFIGTDTFTVRVSDGANEAVIAVTVIVRESPYFVEFQAFPTSGRAPLQVEFTDQSEGAGEWLWEFGDGGESGEQNPVHTYTSAGTYSVSLTIIGTWGQRTLTKKDLVEVEPGGPEVTFTGAPLSGMPPLEVTFTHETEDEIDSFSWDFGDGGESSDPNPTHVFDSPGFYTVRLDVTGPDGDGQARKTAYVEVLSPRGIGGRVTAEDTGAPVPGTLVYVWLGDEILQYGYTGDDGSFQFGGLEPSDDYVLEARPPEESDYVFEFFNGKDRRDRADRVALARGDNNEVFFTLAPRSDYGIRGRVTDGGGNGLGSVKVTLISRSADFAADVFTNADGYYITDNLPKAEDFVVSARDASQGYFYSEPNASVFFWDEAVPVASGRPPTANVNLVMDPEQGAFVSGHVYSASGEPLSGILVNASSETGSSGYDRTESDGGYAIWGLAEVLPDRAAADGYLVEIWTSDYPYQVFELADDPEDASLVETGRTDVDFTMKAGAAVSGTVADSDGNPVAGVEVAAYSSSTGEEGSAVTGTDGAYRIGDLVAAGDYIVAAFPADYPVQYHNQKSEPAGADLIDLGGGDVSGVDFILDRGAVISGAVRLDDGSAAPVGTRVRIWSDSTQTGGIAQTGANGEFELYGLDPDADDYVISVVDSEWQPAFYQGGGTADSWDDADQVPAGEGLDLTLTRGYTIRGLVTADGIPAGGVVVECKVPGGRSVSATTSDTAPDGFNFEITGVAAGTYTINLSSEAYGNQTLYDVVVAGNTVLPAIVMSRGPARTISGVVEGLETGKTATVHAWSRSADFSKLATVTGTGGAAPYRIEGLAAATDYRVEIEAGDYAYQVYELADDWEYARLVNVSENDANGVDFRLAAADGMISGTVVFPENAEPGETVRIVASSDTAGAEGTEAVYGGTSEVEYSIGGLADADDYVVSADSDTYTRRFFDGTETGVSGVLEALPVGANTENVDFTLVSGAKISGTVSGDLAEGMRAEAWSESLGSGGGAPVSEDGGFSIDGLDPADDYKVFVGKPGLPVYYYHQDGTVMSPDLAGEIVLASEISGILIEVASGESISGTVTDRTGSPIGNVWVDVRSESKKSGNGMFTAQNGTYEITGLPPARDYTVSANPEWSLGYEGQVRRNVTAGSESVDLMLKKRDGTASIGGTIRDSRGDHIPNVEVELRSESKGIQTFFVTNRSGSRDLHVRNLYEFTDLPEGDDYVVTARPPADSPHAFYIERNIAVRGETTFNIVLTLGSKIAGRVNKWDGSGHTPAAGAWVTAYSVEQEFLGEAYSGKDGAYTVPNTPQASDYVVIARKDGFFEESLAGQRPGGGVDFILSRAGAISGQVRNRITGRPIAGATVQVGSQYMAGLGSFSGAVATDDDGRYSIGGLKYQYRDLVVDESVPVTDYTVTVHAEGYPPVASGGLVPGEIQDFEIAPELPALSGTASGIEADLIVLDIFENMGDHVRSVRLEDGAFSVAGLPNGEFQLRFTAYVEEGMVVQWAGGNDAGIDETDPDANPEEAKVYTLPAEIDFGFTAGSIRSTRENEGPGPVRRLRSTSHTDRNGESLGVTDAGVRDLVSNDSGIVSANPHITVAWEPTEAYVEEEYIYVFNREPGFVLNRRTAPDEFPIRARRATSRSLSGDDVPYWFHVAAVNKRGRIGVTSSLRFQIDTVPPSNAVVSKISDSADGYAMLSLGATGATDMYVSSLGYGVGGGWEKWTSTREWKIPEDGADEFFVQFRDRAKNTVNAMPLSDTAPGLAVLAAAGPNGIIVPAGRIEVEPGDSKSFRITPNAGYAIDAFLVDGVPATGLVNSYPNRFFNLENIRTETEISVTFREVWHTVTASAGPNGRIEPYGELVLRKDSDQTFTFTPDPGYEIAEISVNGVPATPTDGNKLRLINITEDFVVTVTFGQP